MNKPFFSIIIPVYNVEAYIYRCLESLYNQDLNTELFEVIVVNDGTPDNSIEIISKFKEDHTNIIIYNQKNSGVSSARNRGMTLAKGEYFLFVDPDDVILKNSLKRVYHQLNKKRSEVLILNSYRKYHETTQSPTNIFPFPKEYSDKLFLGIELFKHYNRGSVWGVAYSSVFLNNNNILFNEELKNGEDALFFSMCLIYTKEINYSDIDFYVLYERNGSASRSWDENSLFSFAKGLTQINKLLHSKELSPPQSAILYSLAFRFISHLLYRLFEQKIKKREILKKLKNICILSGVYPICINNIPRQRPQIKLLNISFNIFAFIFYLRGTAVRLIYRK